MMQTRITSNFRPNNPLQQTLLVLLFAGLLSIAFLDNNYYYLAWVAFVPLLVAVEQTTLLKTYLLGLIAGLTLYIGGMYWIVDFIMLTKGYGLGESILWACLYWFYCAHLIVIVLLLFKWLKTHTRLHEFFLFPIIVASVTSAYPMLFAMRLGESQFNFPIALQAIEFTGVHGLDAIMALFNIVIFRLLYQPLGVTEKSPNFLNWPWLLAVPLIALWFVYGVFTHAYWQSKMASWDTLKVGIVQPNETPSLGKTKVYPGYSQSYPPEMDMTERLSSLGADLVVWPEAQAKGYLDHPQIKSAYQNNIARLNSSLLFQDTQHTQNVVNGKLQAQYNSAIMLDSHGQELGVYQKIKRIPFGEYIPIISDDSRLKEWLERFFSEFLTEISAGEDYQLFRHDKVNIVPLICYETTSPRFVGNAIKETIADSEQTNGALLVGLSNDGWFGSTHQPYQHIMASVLRAVENRLPLVHVANNGPSIVVTPNGNTIFTSDFHKAGGYISDVPYSNTAKGSFYSRHPGLFVNFLYFILSFVVFYALWKRLRRQVSPA